MTIELPENVTAVLERLNAQGARAFVVGGCVRDSMLGLPVHDWDVATSASTDEMRECFRGERLIATGEKHGTLTLLTAGGPVEMTTFRVDGIYSNGRRPDSVSFSGDIRDDLARRDFTVNAMAYSPRGGLIDCFGGRADLAAGLIRCVGEAGRRFGEDALRILRAFRFAARLRTLEGRPFSIEEGTLRALAEAAPRLRLLSAERICSELTGIILSERAAETLELMGRCGIWQQLPGETALVPPEVFDSLPKRTPARMAALFKEAGCDAAERFMRGLRFKNEDVAATCRRIAGLKADIGGEYELLSLLGTLGADECRELLLQRALTGEDCGRQAALLERLISEGRCCRMEQLAVNGTDAAALGLCGREIGDALRTLLERVMRGVPNERESLLAQLRELANDKNGAPKGDMDKTERM